jgi:drug/metabolite transporter (DMT)-like permease
MNPVLARSDLVRLLVLAAIWGGSFLLTRIVAPVLGPIDTAFFRILLGGTALLIYFYVIRLKIEWKKYFLFHFLVSVFYTAIPFSLYGYAAKHIPASIMVILNATTPFWATVLMALFSKSVDDRLTIKKCLGLILGISGVSLIAIRGTVSLSEDSGWAIAAGVSAAACYAIASTVTQLKGRQVNAMSIACTSQLFGALILFPLVFASPLPVVPDTHVIFATLALALICSALAFVLYFQLLKNVGPSRAASVTFLMPMFGMFWGWLFLSETITLQMLMGCALILIGTKVIHAKKVLARSTS